MAPVSVSAHTHGDSLSLSLVLDRYPLYFKRQSSYHTASQNSQASILLAVRAYLAIDYSVAGTLILALSLLVSSAWGVALYGEFANNGSLSTFFASGILVVAGAGIVAFFGTAN